MLIIDRALFRLAVDHMLDAVKYAKDADGLPIEGIELLPRRSDAGPRLLGVAPEWIGRDEHRVDAIVMGALVGLCGQPVTISERDDASLHRRRDSDADPR